MFKNYLTIAIRSLWKNKVASFVNIAGLTVSLTCCLLMILYMQHELSYDAFQQKGNRIARVIMEYSFNGDKLNKGCFTSTKVFPAFRQHFPEVEEGVRMSYTEALVKYDDKLFLEKSFMYADSTFFQLFSFKLLQGHPQQVLKGPQMLVITASAAKKYFGNENPVGKNLLIGSAQQNYLVTGVVEDCPTNSQIKFDFLASFSSLGKAQEETYFDANYTTYLLLKKPTDMAALQSKIGPFMKKEVAAGYDPGTYINFILEPYTTVHLHSPFDGFEPNSSITYIYIVATITLLMLAIACFTYINLSTARSIERAKEVGIRKVSGAIRQQVFWQFICESVLLTTISLSLSFILAAIAVPAFNQLVGKHLNTMQLLQLPVMGTAIFMSLLIALLAGSYPAVVLSGFQPVKVLKGSFKNSSSGVWLRQSLLVFQFAVSVFLIVATFVIQQQLHFIRNKNLGYNREQVLVMDIDQKMIDKIDLLKAQLKSNAAILSVSKAQSTPVKIMGGYAMSRGDMAQGEYMSVRGCPVDDEYVATNSLQIIAGSNLSAQDVLDANKEDYTKNYYHYILNESAAKAMGWAPQDAIGKKMFLGSHRPGEVKAVIKDFHFASLHSPIEPLVLFPGDWGNRLLAKISGNNIAGTIAFVAGKWKQLAPHRPFEYRFMDDDFNKMYKADLRIGKLFTAFATIAIFLACIGLFGLSAFMAQQRIKEIGVRKVLGASVFEIVLLLSNNFLKLIALAFIIATPAVWYFLQQWLSAFAYRVHIGWWVFAAAGLITGAIAFATVGYQAVKAAIINPVKSLRTE